jgi:UDP-3-O-[3-hydroxymyristoyl] glucosamine N-acyltransferase
VAGPFSAADLAARLGGVVEGDGETLLADVRGLAEAGPEHLSFLANKKYVHQLAESRAGAVLMDRQTPARGRTAIRLDDPYAAFARALALFHPQPWPEPGVDPRAAVATDAQVDPGATVEAFAWVGPGARVGPGTWIEAGAYVGTGAVVGRDCRLMAHAVVAAGCVLGDRVWLNPGAVVGGEGFGFAPTPAGHVKIPQTGRAVVENDVEIGANSCVDRSTLGDTTVRRGAKLDNLVQVGHGAEIGEGALMAAYAAVAGSARLGRGVVMAGKAGVINHLRIGDGVQLGVHSIALADQPAGAQLAGTPAIDRRRWLRASAAFGDLPQLLTRLRELERRVAELEEKRGEDG